MDKTIDKICKLPWQPMNRGSRMLTLAKTIFRLICRRRLILRASVPTLLSAQYASSSFISPAYVSTVKNSSAKSAFSSVEPSECWLVRRARKISRPRSFHCLKGTLLTHKFSEGAHASSVLTTLKVVHTKRSIIILKSHANIAQ